MLGPSSSGAPVDVVELREEDAWLVVVVRRASGELVGEKRLPATLACAVRAETAAVSIAALEGRLSGGDAAPLDVPPRAAPLEPPPAPPAEETTPSPPETPLSPVVAEAPPHDDPIVLAPGAAALVSLNGSDVAPAGRLEVAVGHASGRWALGLAGVVVGTHRASVLPGEAAWQRWGVELDLRREEPGGYTEARVGIALSALTVGGRSFPRNADATLLDPGLVAGLRFTPFGGRVRPWLELAGALWPRAHDLSVTGGSGKAALPRGEIFLGVGASFGRRR
jgi:hypothetical protein